MNVIKKKKKKKATCSLKNMIKLVADSCIRETGIKVVDLLAPYHRGEKIGLFDGVGVGNTVMIINLVSKKT